MLCLPAHSNKMLSFLGHVILSQHRRRRWILPTQQWLKQTQLFIYNSVSPQILFQRIFQKSVYLRTSCSSHKFWCQNGRVTGLQAYWEQMVTPTAVSKEADGHIYLMCGWWAYLFDVRLVGIFIWYEAGECTYMIWFYVIVRSQPFSFIHPQSYALCSKSFFYSMHAS